MGKIIDEPKFPVVDKHPKFWGVGECWAVALLGWGPGRVLAWCEPGAQLGSAPGPTPPAPPPACSGELQLQGLR